MSVVDFARFVDELATQSGQAILPFFRAAFATEDKAAGHAAFDPVTEADRAGEAVMRRLIAASFPDHGILGEEFGAERADADYVWVLDPIDGTRSFTVGRPIFGTLIALVENGWPVLGIIDQPIARERWLGVAGRPTLFNGQPTRTRTCRDLDGATIATTSPHLFDDEDVPHFMALVAAVSGQSPRQGPVYGGDCYNYGLLASGHIDLVCESGLKLHDFAALVPVVEGAGGRMCDWNGDPLTADSAGHVLAIGDPARTDEVLEALRNVPHGHDHDH